MTNDDSAPISIETEDERDARELADLQARYGDGLRAARPARPTYSSDDVGRALNRAAGQLLKAASAADDDPLTDAINLMVKAGMHFLDHPTPRSSMPSTPATTSTTSPAPKR